MKTTRTSLLLVTGLAILSLPRLTSAVDGMVSYWKFDEGSGDTAYDYVNGNHGTVFGAIWTNGVVNGALTFDGMNDYVGIADSSSLDLTTNRMTIACWIRAPVLPYEHKALVEKGDVWSVGLGPDGKAVMGMYIASVYRRAVSSTALSTDVWYHIAGVYDGEAVRIFVGGNLEASIPAVGSIRVDHRQLSIGSNIGYFNWPTIFAQASVDEIYLFDRTLSQSELATLAQGIKEVEIDIKPDTDSPNPINPNSHGVIPVAILTTDSFDAADVDWTTVELAGAGVALRGKSNWLAHFEDVDGDGDDDLLVQVETDTGSAWLPGEVELTGQTWAGIPIHGSDTVILKPE